MINPKSRNQNSQYDLISHYVLACFPLSYFDPILNYAVIKNYNSVTYLIKYTTTQIIYFAIIYSVLKQFFTQLFNNHHVLPYTSIFQWFLIYSIFSISIHNNYLLSISFLVISFSIIAFLLLFYSTIIK